MAKLIKNILLRFNRDKKKHKAVFQELATRAERGDRNTLIIELLHQSLFCPDASDGIRRRAKKSRSIPEAIPDDKTGILDVEPATVTPDVIRNRDDSGRKVDNGKKDETSEDADVSSFVY